MSMGKENRKAKEAEGQNVSFVRFIGAVALLVLASCDASARGFSGPTIDTLPTGLRIVTNVSPWLDGSAQGKIQATEELNIGNALSGGPLEFVAVSGLEVDGEGRIYVSDLLAHEIRVFNSDGTHSHSFGRKGEGPGELDRPYGVLLDLHGRIWVREVGNMRFSLFERDGTFLGVIPIRHRTVGTWRAGFDPSGHLMEWAFLRPFSTTQDGSVRWDERARSRFDLAFWLLRFREDGSLLDTLPPLRSELPTNYYQRVPPRVASLDFAIDTKGSVWFALSDRYRVWRRTMEGDTLLTFSLPAEALPDPEREEPFKIVHRVLTDEVGHVFVLPQTKEVTELGTAVDAFDSTGIFLARILLPVTVQQEPLLVRGGALYGVTRDSLDVPHVVRLRLNLPGGD